MFGTDNIYFVPDDGRLIFNDLHAAERFEIDVLGLRAMAAEGLRDTMKQKLSAALQEHWEGNRSLTKEEKADQQRQTQGFFDSMEWINEAAAYEAAYPLEAVMAPLEVAFWVRLSDAPLESFAAEDYVEAARHSNVARHSSGAGDVASHESGAGILPAKSNASVSPARNDETGIDCIDHAQFTPANGALEIRALEQWELKLPGEPGEMPLFLRWPDARRAVTRAPIDPLQPLPIIEEYIGPEGVSARGHVANYTLRGSLADTNTGAVPLYQREGRLFVTLYFNIAQQLEFDLMFNRLPARPEAVNERLAANGFAPVNHGPGWAIYARGRDETQGAEAWRDEAQGAKAWRDILHFYYDIEGKESIAIPQTHPFLWITRAGGSDEPGERAKLTMELDEMFPEAPKKHI